MQSFIAGILMAAGVAAQIFGIAVLVSAQKDISGAFFTKTHVAAIKDQLTMGNVNMRPQDADALLTPDK